MEPHVHIFPDLDALSRAAAERWIDLAHEAIAHCGAFHVALAGGSTPRRLYQFLASPGYRNRVDWPKVHVFFGDERFVPADHADSNYRMAREALLDHVPIPAGQIHPVPTDAETPDEAAEHYLRLLETVLPRADSGAPRFHLALLGMGADGHTASLFPGTAVLEQTGHWAYPVYVEKLAAWRISLTYPVFNEAEHLIFLVAGHAKAEPLRRALQQDRSGPLIPVQRLQPKGRVEWYVDEPAAQSLIMENKPA